MHQRHCRKLADRMHALVLRELGQGFERERLLSPRAADRRYTRDVLLVCDALLGTEGPLLAAAFRRAAAALDEGELPAPRRNGWLGWLGLGSAGDHAFASRSSSAPSAT